MTDAVHACVAHARAEHGGAKVDILGVSLSSEFVARAAVERPDALRSVAIVSPTGFSGTRPQLGPPESTRAIPGLHGFLAFPVWGPTLFRLLTRPAVVRYFLERTWGGPHIDEELWAYDVLTARQPGAHHAPLCFLSGNLFSGDANRIYDSLTLPVWMSHGIRGDFVDYRRADPVRERSAWRLDVFPTGALPYFEVPDAFFAAYEGFLSGLPRV
jgi:pimeloyl-ACP methyl ester carboxylesterase